jgi:hypothetical protein
VDLTTGSTAFLKADRLGMMLGLVGLFYFLNAVGKERFGTLYGF